MIDRATWLLLGARLEEVLAAREAEAASLSFDGFDQAEIEATGAVLPPPIPVRPPT